MAKRCERWSAPVAVFAVLDLIVLPSVARAVVPEPTFYLPLDGSATAVIAKGDPEPLFALHNDSILAIVDMQKRTFTQGKVGQGYQINETPLIFRCKGNFRPDEGTCSFWLNPDFRGDDTNIYCAFFGAGQWGMVYKYLSHTSLTFGTAKPDRDLYYDCSVGDITSWRPGQWHHVVVTWSRKNNERKIYVDGERAAQAPFPYHRGVDNGFMYIGSGCELYPGRFAHAKMDEVAIWDCPLNDDEVRELYELGVSGTPVRKVEQAKKQEDLPAAANLQVVRPRTPAQPAGELPVSRIWAAGETVALDGWWEFLPMPRPTSRLPDEGWGLSRVPGYWAMPGETIGPDGKPCAGTWQGKPYSEFAVGYYQRHFDAGQDWREVNVFLQIEGVDGLAEVFVNGHRLDWLPSWEYEAYDVGRVLRYGEENTVTIAVYTRANAQVAGIYGSVYLRLLPETFVNDVAVQPLVEKGQIRFSCDVWHGGEPTEGQIELCVAPAAAPEAIEKRFLHTCRLEKAPRDRPELSYQVQRVDMVFEWKDAHPWTVDDPFIYQVTARIATEKGAGQQSPPVRFGYREFRVRGADFVLNGKPIHLRGHQIDLGWRDQFERVKQLKLAGMNAFELSGPISCDWYARTPYQEELFENILNYADEHGLPAMPILPDAKVLKQRVFEPQVAALYRRRLDKHIRRYGNHPSVVMWYMHFNLAGYPWYIAPSKIDGSYKPTDAAWVERERYALEAERIAHEIDPRPIYHHACGALGSIFTANCYIGPTSPLQERAEWPSRWAEKRLFPLMACEHCLILIPYWFRLRKFPLSEVYASEPIFDELAAKYLGRKAYDVITPELFDLYDTGREPRSSRLMSLIRHHPGYQAVKSLVARESLRSWRTYGVSGIIFNAVNWDFFDDEGRPLPVLQALARYFGDTDMYVAGPEGDWPSKDHTFYAGETVRKQVVLINDLGRDIPCVLRWKLSDKARVNWQEGQIEALSRAGQVCFYPITFRAPSVNLRTTFTLSVEAVGEASMHFKPETFDIQVFPRAQPPAIRGKVLV
jgi:beta-galactosidase